MLDKTRKGITPVIAIALLLLITVGAVGVFWGTVQDFLGGDQAQQTGENLQQVQNLQISMSGEKTSNNIGLVIEKTSGGGVYNVSQLQMEYKSDDLNQWVSWSQFTNRYDGATGTECTEKNSAFGSYSFNVFNELNSSNSVACDTSIEWPSSGDSVSFRLTVSAGSLTKSFTHTCSPASSASDFC